ncbi:uncharacterized protein [Lepisosteus oculatus]|uniref:uncharacterized protein isoform X1 n=1 Tax=Lepisosteus oculatus TaxID=7918 RepID=UPI0035F50767
MELMTLLVLVAGFCNVVGDPVSVSVKFGGSVRLPCKIDTTAVPSGEQHGVRWQTDDVDFVFEFFNGLVIPGPGFETTAEVSREKVGQGDLSLTLHSVTFAQEKNYECNYIDRDRNMEFLGNVRLSVRGHEENVTVTNGHPLNIRLYTRGSVNVQFTPEGSGVSVLVCAVEKSKVTPNQLYKPRVSLQDKTLQLSGVSFSDQGSYTVLDLRADRIISTVRVRVEDSDSTWLVPVIVGIVILAVLVAAGVISVLVRDLRSGQRLSASFVKGSSRAGPSPRSSPWFDVGLLGKRAAGNHRTRSKEDYSRGPICLIKEPRDINFRSRCVESYFPRLPALSEFELSPHTHETPRDCLERKGPNEGKAESIINSCQQCSFNSYEY